MNVICKSKDMNTSGLKLEPIAEMQEEWEQIAVEGAFWDHLGRQNGHVGFVGMKPVNCSVPLCANNCRNSPNLCLVVIIIL